MNYKFALNKKSLVINMPHNYQNIIKYQNNSCKCQHSLCNCDYDCIYPIEKNNFYQKNNKMKEFNSNLINNYQRTRNTNDFNNNNNLSNLNDIRKNKRLEFSRSVEKILRNNDIQLNFSYNNKTRIDENKSFDKISKEIKQFKEKMNKDKEYLNNIQNKLFNPADMSSETPINKSFLYYNDLMNENIKNKKRSFSLSYRTNDNKSASNINQNLNIDLINYFPNKKTLRNVIINNNSNNFIHNNILYKHNLNEFQEDKDNENNLSSNYNSNIIDYPKKHNSFLSNNKNKNKVLNNFIHNNNIFDNNNLKYRKEYFSDNNAENINKIEYIEFPGIKNIEKKQNDYSNMKYLSIHSKIDKIQLNEKEIKNDTNFNSDIIHNINYLNKKNIKNYINKYSSEKEGKSFTNPSNINANNDKDKIRKDLIKYQIKKYSSLVEDITKEKRRDNNLNNNNKRKKISLSNILSNYEIIKSKYDKSKNNFNYLSNLIINKNFTKVKSEIFSNNNTKKDENIQIINKKDNDNNKREDIILKKININIKNDNSKKIKMNSKSSNHNKEQYINNYELKKQNNNIIKTIASFSINIDKKIEKDKDLLIKNLNKKILELENQLKISNLKIKDLSKIIEHIKNNYKNLYIDNIESFNYITIKNHIIKLNEGNLNININKIDKKPLLNKKDLILHFPKKSTLDKSSSKCINTSSDNEQFSYSSFNNYKNMDTYFRNITTTVEERKMKRAKPLSLSKNSKKNILLNKLKITKGITINKTKANNKISNNNFIKDLKINEKVIYTIYPSDNNINILFFDSNLKKFSLQKFEDKVNFGENYINNINKNIKKENSDDIINNNGNIFLYNEGYLYIVTGKNYDLFYKCDPYKKEINKLCNLKYNHSNGNLIFYEQRIFCLSGDYNKKVECYIESKNEWIEIPEMLTERSNFSCCIIREQYLFGLFGYNNISKQYLSNIEFIDLLCENAKWKYLYYENNNNISLFLIGALGINCDDKKTIIFGGYDGKMKKSNNYFYQINLKKNFDEGNYEINDENLSNIVSVGQGLEFNNNNSCYFFNNGFNKYYDENNNLLYTTFDNQLNAHIININNFNQEIYNYE